MGLDYIVQTAYGFFEPGETSADLVERLGRGHDYEIDSLPDRRLLDELGYPDLAILECYSMGDVGGWAICTSESYWSMDPRHDAPRIRSLQPAEPSAGELAQLTALRDHLFPLVEGGTIVRPTLGWFLINSVY